jgi:aminopeptidase
VDARVRDYARLLVERSIGARPGWQVVVHAQVWARPLIEEVERQLAAARAYAVTNLLFDTGGMWARSAPSDLIPVASPIWQNAQETADGFISIMAPENTRDGADLTHEQLLRIAQASRIVRERTTAMEVPWVVCQFPTPALAQDAAMSATAFEDFLFSACLLDWDREAEKMRRIAECLDGAQEVRILGAGTDLTLGLEGRSCEIDDGHINLPGGEVFVSPVETVTEGIVMFAEFPASYYGHEVVGAWLKFEGGRVVDAGAAANEEFLLATLDVDAGARVLGELGIGCNPRITRHTRNVLFDEKIDGTVHLALGRSYTVTGGTNESAVHWDIVKDLRNGGEIRVDGQVVQQNGRWMLEGAAAA